MRFIVSLISVVLIFAIPAPGMAAGKSGDQVSTPRFKYFMHRLFHDYRNTHLAIDSGRFQVADIHLKHMLEYIDDIPAVFPAESSAGGKLDTVQLNKRLANLKISVNRMRRALGDRNKRELTQISYEMMGACADCHEMAKLKFLFPERRKQSVFVEYMHQIMDNVSKAEIYYEEGEAGNSADYLSVTAHVLSILKDVVPDQGPTGIVIDKKTFLANIGKVEKMHMVAEENIRQGKGADFIQLKKELNDICVACHEPERVK